MLLVCEGPWLLCLTDRERLRLNISRSLSFPHPSLLPLFVCPPRIFSSFLSIRLSFSDWNSTESLLVPDASQTGIHSTLPFQHTLVQNGLSRGRKRERWRAVGQESFAFLHLKCWLLVLWPFGNETIFKHTFAFMCAFTVETQATQENLCNSFTLNSHKQMSCDRYQSFCRRNNIWNIFTRNLSLSNIFTFLIGSNNQ